jgi:release factor glutamine methyltransferase
MKAFALNFERLSMKEALREGVKALQAAHVESASLDGRMLLEHATGMSREQLLFKLDDVISANHLAHYRNLIDRRAHRQPMSHIVGQREFFGLSFRVTPSVLDPRADSETLIEAVSKRVKDRKAPLRILDLGTGTGCLLLTLLYEFPNATGVAVDISDEALKVAQHNALALGLQSRAEFIASHWCMQVEGTFDIIISNPPYIPTADIGTLAPEVANFEPKLALDGGADGLSCYRAIVASLPKVLNRGGIAVLELGMGQLAAVETLALEHQLTPIGAAHDLQGIARCLILTH